MDAAKQRAFRQRRATCDADAIVDQGEVPGITGTGGGQGLGTTQSLGQQVHRIGSCLLVDQGEMLHRKAAAMDQAHV